MTAPTSEQLDLALTYAKLAAVVTLGILLFDVLLKQFFGMTLSQAFDKLTVTKYRWICIVIVAGMCLLILHLCTTLFF